MEKLNKYKTNLTWRNVFILGFIVFLLVFLCACGGSLSLPGSDRERSILGGATSGVAAYKVGQEIIKSVTEDYSIPLSPRELCIMKLPENYVTIDTETDQFVIPELRPKKQELSIDDIMVKYDIRFVCRLSPCKDDLTCNLEETWAEFKKRTNGRFTSIELTGHSENMMGRACEAYPDTCKEIFASYENHTIVLEYKENFLGLK